MKKITLMLMVFCAMPMIAQNDSNYVKNQMRTLENSLVERGVHTYFSTQRYCEGETQMFTMPNGTPCFSRGTYYATYYFWEENGAVQMQKLDNCGMFKVQEISDTDFYNYVRNNGTTLKNNSVQKYAFNGEGDGPKLGYGVAVNNCHRNFNFVNGSSNGSQEYMLFDISNDGKEANIHYDYNQALPAVQLDKMLDATIATYERGRKYRRQ